MDGSSVAALYVRGRYQVVPVEPDDPAGRLARAGYAVISPAGERLHHDPSFDGACAWLRQRLQADVRESGTQPTAEGDRHLATCTVTSANPDHPPPPRRVSRRVR